MTTTPQPNYICIKEDKLAELDAEVSFKQKRLNDIDRKIEKMDEKLDKVSASINKLMIQSQKDDSVLEKRLVAIETENKQHAKAIQDNRNRFNTMLSVVIVFFTILTFIFNFILK